MWKNIEVRNYISEKEDLNASFGLSAYDVNANQGCVLKVLSA